MSRQFAFKDGEWVDTWNDCSAAESAGTLRVYSLPELLLFDDWCGCGPQQMVVDAMRDFLSNPRGPHVEDDSLSSWLLAYRADQLGFTEHGTSASYAWLTDAGRSWIALAGVPADTDTEQDQT